MFLYEDVDVYRYSEEKARMESNLKILKGMYTCMSMCIYVYVNEYKNLCRK